jgi:hypothetical protein
MKRPWHKPGMMLLDARATAASDVDAAHWDPNNRGDISGGEGISPGPGGVVHNGETSTRSGRAHRHFDAS